MTRPGNADFDALVRDTYLERKSAYAVIKRLGGYKNAVYESLHRQQLILEGDLPSSRSYRRAFLPGVEEFIVHDYLRGDPESTISAAYSVSGHHIRAAVRRAGLSLRPEGGIKVPFTPEQEAEVVRLYSEEHLAQDLIARKLGTSQSKVSRVLQRKGIRDGKHAFGDTHGMWNGGIVVLKGYLYERVQLVDTYSSMSNSSGYVAQHRLVMARHLGRVLSRSETVHHIDGNRKNNKLENLQLRHGKHGTGVKMRCACCGSYDIVSAALD